MKHFKNISQLLTLKNAHLKDGRNLLPEDLSSIKNASIIFDNEKILWTGPTRDLPQEYLAIEDSTDLSGHCVTPELVDSHTHIIFGGNRASEYMQRLDGVDYQEIARNGGGILHTVSQTNALSADELFDLAVERIERINSFGVGTIEIKSGYSLTYEGEKKLSMVIDRLKKHFHPRIQILNTFMAAHAVPKGFTPKSYIEDVVIKLMKELANDNIIDFVDIFFEQGYFNNEETQLLFNAAIELGIKLKVHADEFNDNKGAILACLNKAVSADHLLATTQDGFEALSKSKTVATLLPGTGLFLGKKQANAKAMLELGCKVSISTDYNPGSCHFDNLLMLASICSPMYPFNSAQMWAAITLNASHALGLYDQGAIVEGLKPRFSIFKTNSISEITYNWGKSFSVSI